MNWGYNKQKENAVAFLLKQNEHFNTALCLEAIHRAGLKQMKPLLAVIRELLCWHEGRVFVYGMNKRNKQRILEVLLIPDLHKLKGGEKYGQ